MSSSGPHSNCVSKYIIFEQASSGTLIRAGCDNGESSISQHSVRKGSHIKQNINMSFYPNILDISYRSKIPFNML